MADPTHSPYNFVPLNGEPERKPYPGLDRLGADSYSGVLTCDLTVLTRLFTADHQKASLLEPGDKRKIFPFLRNSAGTPILQGTTLKGMIRSVYEAAFPSCLPLAAPSGISKKAGKDTQYRLTLLPAFQHVTCDQVHRLCPACRLFGIAQGDDVHAQGRVIVSDAALTGGTLQQERTKLAELSSPKPHHYGIYSRTGQEAGPVSGRKLYYHHDPAKQPAVETLSDRANVLREFAPSGTSFTFRVRFQNLSEEELKRLVSCLVLDAGHAHKLGMAKPLGYGSCAITLREEDCVAEKGGDRYRGWKSEKPPFSTSSWTLQGGWLSGGLDELLQRKRQNIGPVGYLLFKAYAGVTLGEHGRYERSKPNPAPRGSTPHSPEPKKPAAGFAFSFQPSAQEKATSATRSRAVLEVVKHEAGVYTLRDPETQQEGIKFQGGGVRWEVGKPVKVRIVETTKDGKIKKIQPG